MSYNACNNKDGYTRVKTLCEDRLILLHRYISKQKILMLFLKSLFYFLSLKRHLGISVNLFNKNNIKVSLGTKSFTMH